MSAFPLLTRVVGREMFSRLVGMLPPPKDDSLETLVSRDATAIAAILALGPIRSTEEASLAITLVAADCHAHDALRSACENARDLNVVRQCRSQAMMMLRTRAKAAERLEKLQAAHPVDPVEDDVAPDVTAMASEAAEATPPAPPVARASPEAYARRRAVAVAEYGQITRHPGTTDTNVSEYNVSDAPPCLAAIATRADTPAWHSAA